MERKCSSPKGISDDGAATITLIQPESLTFKKFQLEVAVGEGGGDHVTVVISQVGWVDVAALTLH